MATTVRTDTRALLRALREQLILITGLDHSRVIVSALEEAQVPHFGAEQDILIRPLEDHPVDAVREGHFRVDDRRTRSFRVTIRTRLMLDEVGADAARLTDESLGHFRLEDLAYDALSFFQPAEEDVAGEINVLSLDGKVEVIAGVRREADDDNWVNSYFVVSYQYSRDLDQTR